MDALTSSQIERNELTNQYQFDRYEDFITCIQKLDPKWVAKKFLISLETVTIGSGFQSTTRDKTISIRKPIPIAEITDEMILQIVKQRFAEAEEDFYDPKEVKRILELPFENEEVQKLIAEVRPHCIEQLENIKNIPLMIDTIFKEEMSTFIEENSSCQTVKQGIGVVYTQLDSWEEDRLLILFTAELERRKQ